MNAEVPIYLDSASFAYGYQIAALSEQQVLRRKRYSCHLLLVMMIEPAFRGVQDPRQAAWARRRLSLVLDSL